MTTTDQHEQSARVDFDVDGMTCGSCAARVERTLAHEPGVTDASVNFATGKARVTFDRSLVDIDTLKAAVGRVGYELSEPGTGNVDADAGEAAAQAAWLRRVLVAWPLGVAVLVLSLTAMEQDWARWTIAALTVPVQFWVGWPFLTVAVERARAATANMDTLIAMGTLAAFGFSTVRLFTGGDLYFDTAALIIAFLVLGRYFEARAKQRASGAIRAWVCQEFCVSGVI